MMRLSTFALAAFAILSTAQDALADPTVYKCPSPDGSGRVEFTDAFRTGCKPVGLPASGGSGAAETLHIPRAQNGHFVVQGKVNGVGVTFLVDTGASTVAVSDQVAQAGNLAAGRPVLVQTANGIRQGARIDNVKVSIGSLAPVDTTVDTGIASGAPGLALLGQSFLKNYDIQINGNDMVLTRRFR